MKKSTIITLIMALLLSVPYTNTTFAAKVKKHTVTFNAYNGIFRAKTNANKKKIKFKYKHNEKRGYSPSIKRSKYVFNGWYTKKKGGKKYTSKTRINKSVKLYPHWLKRYKIQKKYFDYLSFIFKSTDDINTYFPNSKLISSSTKYFPYKYTYKSSSFTCYYEMDFSDLADKSTYEYSLDTLKCPIKNILNIKKPTRRSTFIKKLAGNKTAHHDLNSKKHIFTVAYGTATNKELNNEDESEDYYIIWRIKLDKKNRIKPTSIVTLETSEDNTIS